MHHWLHRSARQTGCAAGSGAAATFAVCEIEEIIMRPDPYEHYSGFGKFRLDQSVFVDRTSWGKVASITTSKENGTKHTYSVKLGGGRASNIRASRLTIAGL